MNVILNINYNLKEEIPKRRFLDSNITKNWVM